MSQQQSVFEIPASITEKVAQITKNSRDRFGHGVYFMEDDGNGDDDGTQGGDGQDDGGLLDDEAQNGGGDGSDGGGDGSGEDDGSGGNQNSQGFVTQQEFESTLDRRINQAVNTIVNRLGGGRGTQQPGNQGGGSGTQQQGSQGNGGGQQQTTTKGPSAGDVREARLAYREYVTDEIKFLGNEEREHAMTLAQSMLVTRLAEGNDPDAAGSLVAKDVGAQIKKLRKHYEGKVIAALKRTNQLPETTRVPGQPIRTGSTPGAQSGFIKGQETAQRLLGSRIPADDTK